MSSIPTPPILTRRVAPSVLWVSGLIAALCLLLVFTGSEYLPFSLAIGLLLCITIITLIGAYDHTLTFSWRDPAIPLLLWFVWMGLSIIWSQAPAVSALAFWWYTPLPLAFFIVSTMPQGERTWQIGWHALLLLGIGLVSYAIYFYLTQQEELRGPFLNKNNFAAMLNLLALPLVSILLASRSRLQHTLYGSVLFVLLYGVASIDSRGAILGTLAGFTVLYLVLRRQQPPARWLLPAVITALAFIAAHLSAEGGDSRIMTLANPGDAGSSRFVIWRSAGELLFTSPWLGIGPGLFSHAYPSFRDPADSSGGYFVHNDYLEFWIETGLPGLLLLVWGAIAFLALLWKTIPASSATTPSHERAGLFAGLATIAVHSIFTFNLHVPALLLLVGAYLGQLRRLSYSPAGSACHTFRPAAFASRGMWVVFVLALGAIPVFKIYGIGLSSHYLQRANVAAQTGRLEDADSLLQQAIRAAPSISGPHLHRADLLQFLARNLSEHEVEHRSSLAQLAENGYHHAIGLNPFSPKPWHGLGKLQARFHAHNPALASTSYQRALELNPRFVPARFDYGQLLLGQGDKEGALAILTAGLHHHYNSVVNILPYYRLTAHLLREAGRGTEADELDDKIARINKDQQAGDF